MSAFIMAMGRREPGELLDEGHEIAGLGVDDLRRMCIDDDGAGSLGLRKSGLLLLRRIRG